MSAVTHIQRNPFRPGAGHMPPFLAGRNAEIKDFKAILKQDIILENVILTGLRGLGKTVLLDTFKPLAMKEGWLWAGTDLSESSSISEDSIALRLLADLSVVTSSIQIGKKSVRNMGFGKDEAIDVYLNFDRLRDVYAEKPGHVLDKLRHTLEYVWNVMPKNKFKGIIFAYDEAQNLSDHAKRTEYPLSLMLDLFQYIQKNNIPFMLVLTGLPTLFPKLVEARAFAERMFHTIFLDKLTKSSSKMAILKPIEDHNSIKLDDESVKTIIEISGGYPYFIQFICREVYDVFLQRIAEGKNAEVPAHEIIKKLDSDFFYGRWARATDRQREILAVIASLENSDKEFTVQEIVDAAKKFKNKPFSSSHANQLLVSLGNMGLIYKNRHGKYSFAVPLLDQYINRQAIL